jgi:hypothetical protein
MKRITIISLLTLTLLQAGELEKEIKYLGNDGTHETHQIICKNGQSGIVSIDNATREMSVEGENLGKVTFKVAVEKVCGS